VGLERRTCFAKETFRSGDFVHAHASSLLHVAEDICNNARYIRAFRGRDISHEYYSSPFDESSVATRRSITRGLFGRRWRRSRRQ
jgi:hypothetical protein